MAHSIITSPTLVFEDALSNPNNASTAAIVIITSLLMAVTAYLFISSPLLAGYYFVAGIIQWVVFTVIVWFFELAHVKRRKQLLSTRFSQVASACGKLWTINLASSVLLVIMSFLVNNVGGAILLIIVPILVIFFIVLTLGWIIGSAKLLKVVTGLSRGKLFINWVILLVLNSAVFGFLMLLLTRAI